MPVYKESKRTWVEKLCIRTLKCGPIPQHLAVIMDGNRRFAKERSIPTIEGHHQGFERMLEVLTWCKDFTIKELTVYAFSIENFKRPTEEVNGLLKLFREKLQEILNDKEKVTSDGVRFQFIGNLSLFPADLQKTIAELVLFTKDFNKFTLNLCVAYTSREEMTTVVQELANGVDRGLIEPDDISEDLFDRCMYTYPSPPPDLLIRTSGERRLSDFLLWQTSFTILKFTDALWPDFSIWYFFFAILFYQHHYPKQQASIRAKDEAFKADVPDQDCINRRNRFLEDLQRRRMEKLENGKF